MTGAPVLDAELSRARREPGVRAIVVDLSALDFIDSSGLRSVVLADRRASEQGLRFALVAGGEPVHRVFEITRMSERLTWVRSPAELTDDGEPA